MGGGRNGKEFWGIFGLVWFGGPIRNVFMGPKISAAAPPVCTFNKNYNHCILQSCKQNSTISFSEFCQITKNILLKKVHKKYPISHLANLCVLHNTCRILFHDIKTLAWTLHQNLWQPGQSMKTHLLTQPWSLYQQAEAQVGESSARKRLSGGRVTLGDDTQLAALFTVTFLRMV